MSVLIVGSIRSAFVSGAVARILMIYYVQERLIISIMQSIDGVLDQDAGASGLPLAVQCLTLVRLSQLLPDLVSPEYRARRLRAQLPDLVQLRATFTVDRLRRRDERILALLRCAELE